MRKRKKYEISVIDKTYSKTISDETKFYTSDTALELVFKLKETEYTFESAEIVLLNIDDRSLVTRPVAKSLDSFIYELEDDVIPHYGEWHGQLRFEAGETYVSSPVKFRIENDLSNDRPPQLSDVQSWVSLKRYADSLTEELKQAVLSVDGIEDAFNANETVRQSQFDNAEQSRQSTFETNESERAETFESNETARQAQELEREKAESQRQTVFEENESVRTETFNTNEATRQENETTRQQAESERKNAEVIRAENENKRKIEIENIVKNGNFNDGLTNWVSDFSNSTVLNNTLINTGNGTGTQSYISQYLYGLTNGDVHYLYANVRVTNDLSTLLYLGVTGIPNVSQVPNPIKDTWYNMSGIYTNSNDSNILRVRHYYSSKTVQNGKSLEVKQVIDINLTKEFGKGNEPTKEEMDELIKITGYIDGEYALNNKEMLIWTISLIRNNKNAITALGGTI